MVSWYSYVNFIFVRFGTMSKIYRDWVRSQVYLSPPSGDDFTPDVDPADPVREVIEEGIDL